MSTEPQGSSASATLTAERAATLVRRFEEEEMVVATAESCTGGLIAAAITDIAGSSAVFDRGFITYSNEAKRALLGVRIGTLETYGAVSRETAVEMALGALKNSDATVAVAVTGIAGPDGGSAEKPVGLVHLAIAVDSGAVEHAECRFGDIGRAAVRARSVEKALEMLLSTLDA